MTTASNVRIIPAKSQMEISRSICNRSQGVDYTNTELNLKFGRIKDNKTIYAINDDKQNPTQDIVGENSYLYEGEARKLFRKWDNVKYISENPQKRKRVKGSYNVLYSFSK